MERRWSYGRMTDIGAFLTLIQGFCAFAFSCFFLEMYLHEKLVIPQFGNDRAILHYLTEKEFNLIVVMLFFLGTVHLSWVVSSVYLLLGNRYGNEKSIQQFLIVTTIVSITDIVFPFVMLSTTFAVFEVALNGRELHVDGNFDSTVLPEGCFGMYFFLLMGFMRGGGLTFAIDMFFLRIAFRRFTELRKLRLALRGNMGIGISPPRKYLDDDLDGHDIRVPDEEEKLNFRQRTLGDEELNYNQRTLGDEQNERL